MESRFSIGRRINFFRRLRGWTQKELGAKLGFSEKSCDVRVAQYESGDRIPKKEMLEKLAAVFQISPQALDLPELGNWVQRMHIFFALEDMYGSKIKKIDGDYYLRIEDADEEALAAGIRNAVLQEWADKRQALEQGELTKAAYDEWRYNYPRKGEYGCVTMRRDDIEETTYVPQAYMKLLELQRDVAAEPAKDSVAELQERYEATEALIAKELESLRKAIEAVKKQA